jgi:HTH-type transcriptional regulator/antitoxin HigA
MTIKPIKTEEEYNEYLEWVDCMFDKKVKLDTPEGDKLQVALALIKSYEDEHYPIPAPNAIDALKTKMIDLGLKNKDLVGKLGSKSHVSNILNKRKPLTLENAKILCRELGIPAEVLMAN